MKHLFLISFFVASGIIAQTNIDTYKNLYQTAIEDSVITENEQVLLDALQSSLGLTDTDIQLSLQREVIIETKPGSKALSQEGRWWIIYQNMALGNGLYGFGVPYVLGIEDRKVIMGTQLLLFAGGFYTTWMYTKEMDISYGRAYSQNFGASLGIVSVFPLMALVGFDNWEQFDPDEKAMFTYMMTAAPIGIYYMDKLYQKWQPTDGQTSMIIGGSILSGFNTWIGYTLITDIPDDPSDTWIRIGLPLAYSGALAGGYYTHRFVKNKSYTKGDASFVGIGTVLGFFTWIELAAMFELEEYREMMLTGLISINGYTYIADEMVQDMELTVGDAGVIALGTTAGYLTWLGIALIADLDYEVKGARIVDIASATAGFYLTSKAITKRKIKFGKNTSSDMKLSMQPIIMSNSKSYIPGMNFTLSF